MTNTIFERSLKSKIDPWLYQGKVIILYGPRQVGKTTLANQIISEQPDSLYLNCERTSVRDLLLQRNLTQIRDYIGNARLVVFDEAQKIAEIGIILKLLIDNHPQVQYIATGSSSFDLSNALSEPLTGRNVKFTMYPLSIAEMSTVYDRFRQDEMLEQLLLYGSYPDIVSRPVDQKLKLLDELTNDYLFRDVLQFENIRKSDVLFNLLKAIALQIGNEVSVRELSGLLKVAVETVQRYLTLLEKSFVIFSLPSFSRNLRNEIAKGQKYYFYDLGIRNNLLQNFTPVSNRNDIGQLWENFCLVERIKFNQAFDRRVNHYFWRTYQQKEIDLIEEHSGQLHTFEFKWSEKGKAKMPELFITAYPDSTFQVVNRGNYHQFLVNDINP